MLRSPGATLIDLCERESQKFRRQTLTRGGENEIKQWALESTDPV